VDDPAHTKIKCLRESQGMPYFFTLCKKIRNHDQRFRHGQLL
jgi:hypothetical protein